MGDHPLGLVRFDVGPEVHDAAASFCLREVARRLGHVYRFDRWAVPSSFEWSSGLVDQRRALASCLIRLMILSGTMSVKNQ